MQPSASEPFNHDDHDDDNSSLDPAYWQNQPLQSEQQCPNAAPVPQSQSDDQWEALRLRSLSIYQSPYYDSDIVPGNHSSGSGTHWQHLAPADLDRFDTNSQTVTVADSFSTADPCQSQPLLQR